MSEPGFRIRVFPWHALAAITLTSVAVAAPAQSPAEYNAQGVAAYNEGRWDDAIRAFERAYDGVPDNATVRRNLCNAHQAAANELAKTADFAGAAKHLELAIAIDPENYSPLVQLGSYYLRLDLVAEAIARLEEAIELAPQSVDAHDMLGDAYYMDNDIPSAMIQWKWVSEVQPERQGLRKKMDKASREGAVESNFRPSGSRHFQLTYTPEIPGRALRRVLNLLERAYIDIGRNFSNVYPPTPIQVIVYNAKGFSDATQAGAHIGALYDGKIRIPLLDADGNALDDPELKQRLYHEYTHVVVRFLGGTRVPWWLNEGLAETFSRPFGPIQTALIQKAGVDGQLFMLAELDASQLGRLDPDRLRIAYAQGHATVNFLWSKFGQRRLTALMSAIAEGVQPEDAVHQTYGRSYPALLKEVLRAILRD